MTLFIPENHYFLGKIKKNEGKNAFFCKNIWYNANYLLTLHRQTLKADNVMTYL